jgi:uncharacterized damage-inducible protein DinB
MNSTQLIVKMVLDRWDASLKNFDKLLQSLSDAQFGKDIVPGKNRGIYILGHLIAVHDDMLRKLDMGEMQYLEMQKTFVESPDKTVTNLPSMVELRNRWKEQCELLNEKFSHLKAEDWLEKHTAVSEEDFKKEPHRNKLNIIITRTTHLAYHTGQVTLLK